MKVLPDKAWRILNKGDVIARGIPRSKRRFRPRPRALAVLLRTLPVSATSPHSACGVLSFHRSREKRRNATHSMKWSEGHVTRSQISNAIPEITRSAHGPSHQNRKTPLKIVQYPKGTHNRRRTYETPSGSIGSYAKTSYVESCLVVIGNVRRLSELRVRRNIPPSL